MGVAALALLLGYAVTAVFLYLTKDFTDTGPLAPTELSGRTITNPAGMPTEAQCFGRSSSFVLAFYVRRVRLESHTYFLCERESLVAVSPSLDVTVIDTLGHPVRDVGLLKRGGVWPWIGEVTELADLVAHGVLLMLLLLFLFVCSAAIGRAMVNLKRRKVMILSLTYIAVMGVAAAFVASFAKGVIETRDPWGLAVLLFYLAALTYGGVAAWWLIRAVRIDARTRRETV